VSRLGSALVAAVATLASTAVASTVLAAAPAEAAPLAVAGPAELPSPVTARTPAPAAGHDLMFDTCDTPSIAAVRAWQSSSPYRAIAAYIPARSDYDMWACRDRPSRANLTPAWVDQVLAGGWNLLPIQVGLQAPCSGFSKRMSADPATARAQGAAAAADAAATVRALRVPATSPVVADIEGYATNGSCARAVQSYVAGWTTGLHQYGLRSAVYGSKASTIADVVNSPYTRPDVIWVANYNGQANTTFDAGLMPSTMWAGLRISQFNPSVSRSYGGVTMNVDEDAVQASVWDRTGPRLVARQPARATKAKRVRLGWRAVDPSGVRSYQVRVRHDGGRWKSSSKLRRTKRTSQVFTLSPGERWCVQSRATDRVGNTSPWSPARCTTRFRDDRSLRAGKGWKRVHGGYLGTGTRTVRKGAVLHGKRVSGRYVGVLLHGRGTVAVLIHGRVVGTVRGNGAKWIALPAARSGRIAFRTVSRGRVVVDGYAVTP
jgi:hypothetical protein